MKNAFRNIVSLSLPRLPEKTAAGTTA